MKERVPWGIKGLQRCKVGEVDEAREGKTAE